MLMLRQATHVIRVSEGSMVRRAGQATQAPVAFPTTAPVAEQAVVTQQTGATQSMTEQQVAARTGLAQQEQAVQNFAQSGEHQVAPRKLGLLNLLNQMNGGNADWGRVPAEAQSKQLAQLAQQARAQAGGDGDIDLSRDPQVANLANDMGWKPPFSFEEALFLLQMKYAQKTEQKLLEQMNELAK
jgi:hypothetical protein